ncbi:predicted protein [Plenodomus lingam JN3]|uniref:Predicted protein n=1 Tax=Leptosphaeria maculans (strain JN3 / isolate v23.1.3 / race Av1-4-5-6-7-8) TaxID=985895 RepID=E4ZTE5_LEPMJ|nr:predicted protein [Plenodomus lingam JN3]CBX94801.1 predicted protein [Plenodomus lingam JN3]
MQINKGIIQNSTKATMNFDVALRCGGPEIASCTW